MDKINIYLILYQLILCCRGFVYPQSIKKELDMFAMEENENQLVSDYYAKNYMMNIYLSLKKQLHTVSQEEKPHLVRYINKMQKMMLEEYRILG